MKKYENPEGEHLEVCEGRSSPSDTPFLATRFWCGDGRAACAASPCFVGENEEMHIYPLRAGLVTGLFCVKKLMIGYCQKKIDETGCCFIGKWPLVFL